MATGTPVDLSGDDLIINNLYTGASRGQGGTLVTLANGAIALGAGSATVAPLTLTSGTKLTTATAGAIEYDGSAFYATAVASSRQMVDTEQYTILNADYVLADVNTAQAALNSTAAGAITLVAGKTYLFEASYNITNTGTTAHTWATVFGGTATFSAGTSYRVVGQSTGTANTAATGSLAGFFSGTSPSTAVVVTASSTSATEQVSIWMKGILKINAAGTVIPQVKLSAATTGTETMLAGSFFRIWETGGTGAVGNWS